MTKTSPTKRSMDALRNDGWTVAVVEKFNRFGGTFGIRQDLYGFIDILAMHEDRGFLGVQTTTAGGMRSRLRKIEAEKMALTFIRAGGKVEVHGWLKGGPRSVKPGRWICKVIKYPEV